MQYAQIVVNTKTSPGNDIFTYKISPADLVKIRPGILVTVPFHGRNLEGIVVALKKSLPINLSPDKLKKIRTVLEAKPVVDNIHLQLAQWMSKYYLASLGETLFENLVPIAKRQIKANGNSQIVIREKSDKKPRLPITNRPSPRLARLGRKKPILIQADFETRFRYYLKSIRYAISHKLQAIVIVPDLTYLEFFKKYLPPQKITILSSAMTHTERYLAWRNIRDKNIPIILGSASAIFAPVKNLGLVIIDQEESPFYKSEQSPRWHAAQVAEKLTRLAQAQLILGSLNPNIESYFKARKKKYRLLKKTITKTPTKIIDLNQQKGIISYELEEAIGATLKDKGRIILFVNRKGEGRILSCPDCGYKFLCHQCQAPLVPQQNKLICHHCLSQKKYPPKCPQCKNNNLKKIGITTDQVKHLIEKIFPRANILRWEKEVAETLKIKPRLAKKILTHADIIVGTFYLTKSRLPKADLVAIVNADQSLTLPDFRTQAKAFSHLLQIIRLGKSAILQTFTPNHHLVQSLQKNSYEDFYSHEIKDRRDLIYPPFSKMIRFIYKDTSEEKCQIAGQKLARQLKYQILIKKIPMEILGPSPAFFAKIRGQFRYHLILKLKTEQNPDISKIDKNWLIDVDPINML